MFVLVPVCSGLHALLSTSGVLLISILCLESGSLTELGTHRFKEIILSVSPQDWTDSPLAPSTGVTGAVLLAFTWVPGILIWDVVLT